MALTPEAHARFDEACEVAKHGWHGPFEGLEVDQRPLFGFTVRRHVVAVHVYDSSLFQPLLHEAEQRNKHGQVKIEGSSIIFSP